MGDNVYKTLLASAARTTTVNTEFEPGPDTKAVIVFIDATVDPSTASITPHLEGYDPLSDNWYTVLTGAAIASVSEITLRAGEFLFQVTNLQASFPLPRRMRFRMAVADAESMTYSVGLELVN